MITIKEIADMLDISTTTVSNVIHGKTGEASGKTVERVQRLLEQYEYVPNINARNLAQNQSKIIGLAIKGRRDKYMNVLADPFFGPLLGAIELEVHQKGYFMMIYISNDMGELMGYVSTWNVDGLILSGMTPDDYIKVRSRYKKPMVLIDSYLPKELTKYVNIGLEDKKGAYEMARYLISQGHKRIGVVTDNLEGVDYYRYQGFEQAMKEAGLPVAEDNLILMRPGKKERESSLEEIYNERKRFTVFMCMSDFYAALIIGYLYDRGICVPEDISVTGYDDNIVGRMIRPGLTTVHQNVEKKGTIAVETLIRMIDGEELYQDRKLPVNLVLRNSVKNLNEIS